MFEFFDQIVGYIEVIWHLFQNVLNTFLAFFGFLTSLSGFSTVIAFYVPSFLSLGVGIFFAIALIKIVLKV